MLNRELRAKNVRLRWQEGGRWRIEDLIEGGAGQAEFTLAGRGVRVLGFERE